MPYKFTYYVYSHLFRTARQQLEAGKDILSQETNDGFIIANGEDALLGAVIFSAFAVEALLNHAGSEKIPYWSSVERKLGPREKMELVLHELGLAFDKGARPYQSFSDIFRLRDRVAHARPHTATYDETQVWWEGNEFHINVPGTDLFPDWYNDLRPQVVERYVYDLQDIGEIIDRAVDPGRLGEDEEFSFGLLAMQATGGDDFSHFRPHSKIYWHGVKGKNEDSESY